MCMCVMVVGIEVYASLGSRPSPFTYISKRMRYPDSGFERGRPGRKYHVRVGSG